MENNTSRPLAPNPSSPRPVTRGSFDIVARRPVDGLAAQPPRTAVSPTKVQPPSPEPTSQTATLAHSSQTLSPLPASAFVSELPGTDDAVRQPESTFDVNAAFETPEHAVAEIHPTTTPTTEENPAVVMPRTTKKRSPILFMALVLVPLLLTAAGIIGYYYLMGRAKPAVTTTPIAKPVTVKSSDIVAMLKNVFPTAAPAPNQLAPAFNPGGTFLVRPSSNEALAIPLPDATAAADAKQKISTTLIGNGLKERTDALDTYDTSELHCQITNADKSTTVICADKKAYQDTSAKLAPLYSVLTAARPVDKSKLPQTVVANRWQASKTPGYTIVTLALTDAKIGSVPVEHLLYQTPDKSWHYVGEAASTTGCGNFNSTDLKKAYLGEVCMNGPAKSTVVLK